MAQEIKKREGVGAAVQPYRDPFAEMRAEMDRVFDSFLGRGFFSRPALRAFVTYANWSDGLRGFVGGTPYANKTSGLTYGVQVETWW